jgi:hypothetical protein
MAAALKSFGRSKKHFRKEKRSQQASKKWQLGQQQ